MNKLKFLFTSFYPVNFLFNMFSSIMYNIKYYFKNSLFSLSSKIFNSKFGNNVRISLGAEIINSKIGDYSYVGKRSILYNTIIGNYCSIANDVRICLGKHPINLFSTNPFLYDDKSYNYFKNSSPKNKNSIGNVIIQNDVWIGANVVIIDDVVIGTGSVIAAGSVVTKNVEPYSIVAGVPAKIIKYRFNPNVIVKLLKTNWFCKLPSEIDYKLLNKIINEK